MKKITTLVLLLSVLAGFAQSRVGEKVQKLVAANTQFKRFSPLTATSGSSDKKIAEVVDKASFATVNASQMRDIAVAKYEAIELDIPYNGTVITTQLYRVNVLAEGFHVDTDKSGYIPYQKGAYYRGIVKGDYNSLVSFNFFNEELNGIISTEALSNVVVGRLDRENNFTDYIIYSDANLKILNDYTCGTKDIEEEHDHNHRDTNGTNEVLEDNCVTVYFEIDNEIYQQRSSNTTLTANWMTSVFNNVQSLYANSGINTALKSMYIWTTPDPYSGTGSGDYLYMFNDVRPVFDGDVGQLIGIDPGGLGGVAVTIGGICSNNNFSYSDVDISFNTVPTFSWTVQVITHELGHLYGSPHTHGCYWNGNNTAIDGCGTQAGYQEGNCAQGPIPSSFTKGTIMSYCHLVQGVGINFVLGFGDQPGTRIYNHVNSRTCLSKDCVNTCINTVSAIAVTSTASNSANLTWTDDTAATSWRVSVAPFAGNFTTWTTVFEKNYTINNLNPNTYYKFAVRPVCPDAAIVNNDNTQLIFATAASFCGGLQFTDTGGTFGGYGNNQTLVRVFTPEVAGAKARVTFSSFNTEQDYDFLTIYDGSSTDAPIIAELSGNFNPGTFESTAADGSLTFRFRSDTNTTAPGWVANMSCGNLGVSDTSLTNFAYYPNPSGGIVNIKAGEQIDEVTIYNVAGQLLMSKKVNASETSIDISSFAEGVYFFRAGSGSKEVNFRIIKQN